MTNQRDGSPIAVIGYSFRLPGGTEETLWKALLDGRDLVTSVAADRWGQESFSHPSKNEPGKSYTFAAGSIGDVAGFDAAFFGISPREAEQMDPQQRVLLELAWETFECAGVPPASVRGSRCGVYVGLSSVDYSYRRADDLNSIDSTTMTGNAGSIAANRLSYVFDLRGPSMVVDTACSSSLVAFHQGCQSIRTGETDAALVGGISLHLHPYGFIGFSKASMLSNRGRCRVFDAGADGYVRSEGGGIVLLKTLDQALADGNRILAVVAGTGVNSDGRKQGLTVPNHEAQAALLREVYGRAGIAPAEIDYFEAHGTGTAVGDPLETRAIGEALGRHRPANQPLPIGSIKGNIGHLEAASGMAGLFKALHVLRDRRVPANPHPLKVNPHIEVSAWNLAPVTETLAFGGEDRLVVGVSAFGFGGTNAHAVLTSFEAEEPKWLRELPAAMSLPKAPLFLSARSPQALRDAARDMALHLRARAELTEYDIAYSAAHHRDVHSYRLAAAATDRQSLAFALDQFAIDGAAVGVQLGTYRPDASAPAFVYSGNGSQWAGMGLQLLQDDAVFRDALLEVDALYVRRCGQSVLADLNAPPAENRFARTENAQPALFAIQVALTRTLERRGVRPIAVCGHSVGEVAATWASGALTLEQAVRVVHERSSHQGRTQGQGCMTAVAMGYELTLELLAALQLAERITIAAINSANAVTLAGDHAAMSLVEDSLSKRQIGCQRLALDYAFHSRMMDPIRADLLHGLSGLEMRSAALPMYSSVTGDRIGPSAIDAGYWWRNVREPVKFEAAIRAMLDAGINTFVEIGPRAVLTTYLAEITRSLDGAARVLPSLTRREADSARLSALTTQLELSGGLRDRTRLFPLRGRCVELPHYPWQRERHWLPTTLEGHGSLARRIVHPLLGYERNGDVLHWENQMDLATLPVYADHRIGGAAVFPASGFVEMALAAGLERRRLQERAMNAPLVLEDLEIVAPLILEADRARTVRLRMNPADGRFTIVSRERLRDDPWHTHASGRIVEDCLAADAPPFEMPNREPDVSGASHYAFAAALGLAYGPAFRAVQSVWYRREGILGSIATPVAISGDIPSVLLHPVYLDGAFQLLADVPLHDAADPTAERAGLPAFLPVRIERLELLRPHVRVAAGLASPATATRRSPRSLQADFTLYDELHAPIAIARGVRFRSVMIQTGHAERARWISTRAVPMPRRDSQRATAMPSIEELARRCAARLHSPERVAARRRFFDEFEPLLDVLCASFAARGLREITGDQPLAPQALLDTGRVAAPTMPLLLDLLQLLVEDGVLQLIAGQWFWRTDVVLPRPEDIWMSLVTDYPEYAALTARVGSAGLHLAERLRSVARMPVVHDIESAERLDCTKSEGADVTEALWDVVRCTLAAQPAHARLRVLRFANGGARDSFNFIPKLDADRCDLVLAAATQALLDDVRGRFVELDGLEGRVIDLDGELAAHEFRRYDMVLLSEGVADAPDPVRRLSNARRLLLDEGRLVVLENNPSRAADLIFGLEQRSRRCTSEAWRARLTQSGFALSAAVPDIPGAPSGQYLLIAQADAAPSITAEAPPEPARTWLIARDASGYSAELGQALGAALAAAGQRVHTVIAAPIYERIDAQCRALDPDSTSHWERLLSDLKNASDEPHGLIHLVGLDPASAGAAHDRSAADRIAVHLSRATAFTAWLKTCARQAIHPECWVIGAHAGTALLPEGARSAASTSGAPPPDPLRDAALWGLTRVAMHEFPAQRIRWVDLQDPLPCTLNAQKLAEEILRPDAEDEILLTTAGRYVPRLCLVPKPRLPVLVEAQRPPRRVQLDCSVPGPFRNLTWQPTAVLCPLGEDEVEIDVRTAGLNFRDVMYAMGLLPDEAVEDGFCGPTLGMEVAGIITQVGSAVGKLAIGDAVLAFAPASFANRVRTRSLAVVRKPLQWSFAAAATVPSAFFTAYYALHELAHLREGERVLIHGAAGGVGIAAIQIAQHCGAEIFATAGSDAKRDFVRLLGADHVFDSRSLAFADEVMRASGGSGVDVILNSLAGDAMARNLRLLRPFGRMLELGKRDFYENSRIGLRPLRNNISYFGIDADQLLAQRPETARRVFIDLMALFAEGSLTPLPHRSFDAADIADAFRYMQASRHIGKVIVSFAPDFDPLGPARATPAPVAKTDATYVVTGGLSGFGLRTAWWLVSHGAKHLALLSRRGAAHTPGAKTILKEFAEAGVAIAAPACDVCNPSALADVLTSIETTMPPVRGIVHAAMVIEDALLRDIEPEQMRRVLAPKIGGALNLHEVMRDRELDFFILYSSATTLFGNPGQGAYVAANMALEALAAQRRALGLPVTCIGWGPIADAGYLARNERLREALVARMGGAALQSEEALDALGTALGASAGNLGFTGFDWPTLSRFLPSCGAPKFSPLASSAAERGGHRTESAQELRHRLNTLSGVALVTALIGIVRAEVAEILRIAPERIESGTSLLDMGMDSLMAVELATSLEARLDIRLSALALGGGPTIDSVVERIARLLHADEEPAVDATDEFAAQVLTVVAQHVSDQGFENAAELSVELSAGIHTTDPPLSLTSGQRL